MDGCTDSTFVARGAPRCRERVGCVGAHSGRWRAYSHIASPSVWPQPRRARWLRRALDLRRQCGRCCGRAYLCGRGGVAVLGGLWRRVAMQWGACICVRQQFPWRRNAWPGLFPMLSSAPVQHRHARWWCRHREFSGCHCCADGRHRVTPRVPVSHQQAGGECACCVAHAGAPHVVCGRAAS